MTKFRTAIAALAFASTAIVAPALLAPAGAAVDASDPQRFVQTLTTDAFAAANGDKGQAKAKFRALLAQHVAVDEMGDRLIRRWLPTITPAQRAAYKAALPTYLVGTYTDNLITYSDATIKVISAQPGNAGMASVITTVQKPGRSPVRAIWSLMQVGGRWKVSNVTVAGINVAMAQAADFDSVVQRQGFDALVRIMRARG
ncbi:MlaC/ttg2D family ABC transporter substrate-binding protein [Sphingomonas bacterium]|uniref:MlaC/ttg2D family ABC transporter substrate-binding protein n=1 Tax=Sphingomonas bacterium TaxID=1895847 RepID=UPI001575320B|nr:ABC transporter substrate-binding protein [Sphingomonas bacterium]